MRSRLLGCLVLFSIISHGQFIDPNQNGKVDLRITIMDENGKDPLPLSVLTIDLDRDGSKTISADFDGLVIVSFCPRFVLNGVVSVTANEYGYFSKIFNLSLSGDTAITLHLKNNPNIQSTKNGIYALRYSLLGPFFCKEDVFLSGIDLYYELCDGRIMSQENIKTHKIDIAIRKRLTCEPYLIPICETDECEPGDRVCYINPMSDTIVPYGTYLTNGDGSIIKTWGGVLKIEDGNWHYYAINNKGKELFEIHPSDNGPDYLECGRFRIIKDGKIGFADHLGNIIVEPQFECAGFFRDGKARVAYYCELTQEDEYNIMESDNWFYIDVNGKKID